MKRRDIKALADKTQDQLQEQLQTLLVELSKAKLAKKAGKLKNLRSTSILKDDIARVKTVMSQKALVSLIEPVTEVKA